MQSPKSPLVSWALPPLLLVLAAGFSAAHAQNAIIDTVAGGGPSGIPAPSFAAVSTSVMAADSGDVYFAVWDESSIGRIFKVDPNGIVTLIAGDWEGVFPGDGRPATKALLGTVFAMVRDATGNLLFAEYGGDRVRRIDAATGLITTVAGMGPGGGSTEDGIPAGLAHVAGPFGLALDAAGSLYVSEQRGHRVRRVDAVTGIITTVAGTGVAGFGGDGGPAASAQLNRPREIAFDPAGDLYIADAENHRVRKVSAATGVITTTAGNGIAGFGGDGGAATGASLTYPSGLAVDSAGDLFISDYDPNAPDGASGGRVRRVDIATGTIALYAGAGPPQSAYTIPEGVEATQAEMHFPEVIDIDAAGKLFTADTGPVYGGYGNVERISRVRRVEAAAPHLIWSLFGYNQDPIFDVEDHGWGDGGPATSAFLSRPSGLAYDLAGNLYVTGGQRVRRVSASNASIVTVAGTGQPSYSGAPSGDGGPATAALLRDPRGAVLDGAGNLLFADRGNHRIRRVEAASGIITTYAGTGTAGFGGDGQAATRALLNFPSGVALGAAGDLFIADTENHRVRVVAAAQGKKIDTVAGNGTLGFSGDGGDARLAQLARPHDVKVAPNGDLVIADTYNLRIRRVSAATGVIATIAGNGTPGYAGDGGPAAGARIGYVETIAVDEAGDIFIADTDNQRIRRIDAASGMIETVAGTGVRGSDGDGGAPLMATLDWPRGIAAAGSGFAFGGSRGGSSYGGRVREVSATSAPTAAGEVPGTYPTQGSPGVHIALDPLGLVTLSWAPSCASSATDYEVYEGTLGAFTSHAPLFCTTGGKRSVTFAPGAGDVYYLVVPRSYASEGTYGRSSAGAEIPSATGACLPQEISGCN